MKLIVTKYKQGIGVFEFDDNLLVKANIFNEEQKVCIGDIYLGRVSKILPNINACFVQVGSREDVFLPFDEIYEEVKCGEYILVQIKKEASKGKKALGTTKLSISGVYCVVNYEPYSIEISSKLSIEDRKHWKQVFKDIINSDNVSKEDKNVLSKYCTIIRTNVSECTNVSELIEEWISISKSLDFVLEKGKNQSLYTKLYSEQKQYLTYIKDCSQSELEEIVTDDIEIYTELNNYYKNKVRYYQDEFSLWKLYSLESKLRDALNSKVWLKSGGFMVIEHTEALTVIDVNSGKFDKKGEAEEFYRKVNKEAALEIAKHIKLRNISGIIIIDFINMNSEENKKEILEVLSKLVSKDKVKTNVVGMTALGLVEMTRAKTSKPLYEQIQVLN